MKERILECDFDPTDKLSIFSKQNKYGTFTGISYCQDEDEDIMNRWDGLRFAEKKCDIQVMREKARIARERARGMEIAYKNLLQAEQWDNPVMLKLLKQVKVAKRDAANLEEKYKKHMNNYQEATEKMLKIRRDFRNRTKEYELSDN